MNTKEKFEQKVKLLKDTRLQLLQLHKMLVDLTRENYEKTNGQVSSGKFLNLLISNDEFSWLRKFSILIVEIDEMFDLDDGYEEYHLDINLKKIEDLISLNTEDKEFNQSFTNAIKDNDQIKKKKESLESLFVSSLLIE